MTKLSRITGKTFGETADPTDDLVLGPQIGQFGSALAGTYVGTSDVATIQSLAAWSNGFIDAVTPTNQYPPLPEMTGALKVLSYQENYILQQGIPEWDDSTTYYTDNFCAKNGKVYISLSDSNLNNDPAVDTVNWKEQLADTSLSNLNNTGTTAAAHYAMPSGTSVDLTFDVSGTEYTAPADGYFAIAKYTVSTQGAQCFIQLALSVELSTNCTKYNNITGQTMLRVFLPVKKGDKVTLYYQNINSSSQTGEFFKFLYAEGSKWEYTP